MSRSAAKATIETVVANNDVDDLTAAARNEPNDLPDSAERMIQSVRRSFGTEETVELIEEVAGTGPIGTDDRAGRAGRDDLTRAEAEDFDASELVPERWDSLGTGDVYELVPLHGPAAECDDRGGQIVGVASVLLRTDRHPSDVEGFASEYRDLMERMTDMLAFRDCVTEQQAAEFEAMGNEALAEWLTDPTGIKARDRVDNLIVALDDAVGLPEDDDDVEDLDPDDFRSTTKGRRVRDPKPGDAWPGSWEMWDSPATRLPSWQNDEGTVIRADSTQREPLAFVHTTGFDERWTGKIPADLHDPMWRFMEENP